MSQNFLTVDQVAELLGLHVRTVRNHVRAGRLGAVRIGKQYRITRKDLEAFTGQPLAALEGESVRRVRHVAVSSIVEIDAIDPAVASRISNGILGAAKGRDRGDAALRIDCIYDEQRARLKVIVSGALGTTSQILGLIGLYLE